MVDSSCGHPRSGHPMRIVLLYAWGNANAGDKALALGTVESLRQCFPDVTIHVVSILAGKNDQFAASRAYITDRYSDVHVIPDDLLILGGRRPSRVVRLFKKVIIAFGLLYPQVLRLLWRKSSVFAALQKADVILLNGGHLLFWSDRMGQKRRIAAKYLLPLIVARRLGKAYGLHAQSYGPFEFSRKDWLFRWAFRYVLTGARYLSVRESASLSHLKSCTATGDRVKCVLDSAFFLSGRDEKGANALLERHGLVPNRFLALTLRLSKRGSQKNLPPELYESYAQKVAEFVSLWARNESFPIAFVCQVPKDVEDTQSVLSRVSDVDRAKCVVLEHVASPELLIGLYANARAVVGMRFHSLIFALLAGAPVMGVYYYDIGPKIEGIMKDLGYPEYAFSLDQTDGSGLYQSVSRLLANAKVISQTTADRVESLRQASLRVMTQRLIDSCRLPVRDRRVHADVSISSCRQRAQDTEANRLAARDDIGVR